LILYRESEKTPLDFN